MAGIGVAVKAAGKARKGGAAAGTAAPKARGLSSDPAGRISALRGEGLDDEAIRGRLEADGYSPQTARNAAPGTASKRRAVPAPVVTPEPRAEPSTPAPAVEGDPEPAPAGAARTSAGKSARRDYLDSRPVEVPGNVSGFVLGLLGTAALINFMRGGMPQVKQWATSKLTNNTTAAPTLGGSGGSGLTLPDLPRSGFPIPPPRPPPPPGSGGGGGGGSSW